MNTRRTFLSVTSLAVAGLSIPGLQGQTHSAPRSAAERDVFQLVSRYGSAQSVTRPDGNIPTVAIQVRMRSREAFAETYIGGDLPVTRIHAAGNMLRFEHQGTTFLLEHLA